MQELNSTAHKILDVAEQYTQLKGFNAFSYKDIQREVGIKTSSIHYYFPTKHDLALSMTERYVEDFRATVETLANEEAKGFARLQKLGSVYADIVASGRFCMCGMLASDMFSLPDSVHKKVSEFFQIAESWIKHAIELGQKQGDISAEVLSASAAAQFLSILEGGMLISRAQKSSDYLVELVSVTLKQMAN